MTRRVYRPLKVLAKTADALFAFIRSSASAYEAGRCGRWWDGVVPTADEAVAELLRRNDAHKARSKRARMPKVRIQDDIAADPSPLGPP